MAAETPHTPEPPRGPVRTVSLLDLPVARVRRPVDLALMLVTLATVVAVLALSVYAYRTATGVTADVRSVFSEVIRNILLVPVNAIEGFLTLILPILVIVDQLRRRQPRNILDAIGAAAAAVLVTAGVSWLLSTYAPIEVLRALRILSDEGWMMTVTPMVAGLAAFLTAIGTRSRRRLVAISWNLLWIVLVVSVIAGEATLVGAIVSVLMGRAVGLGMRYASGVRSERAHGQVLVDGVRRAGVDAVSVIRIGDYTDVSRMPRETVTVSSPIGYVPDRTQSPGVSSTASETTTSEPAPVEAGVLPPAAPAETAQVHRPHHHATGHVQDSATVATEREGANRVYAVTDADGVRWDAVVLDADRQVIGWLNAVVSTLARRGLDRRATVSLRQAAERASLMYYAAAAADVNCPRLHGIAEAGDSVLLLGEHVPGAYQLSDLPAGEITDEVMLGAWEQISRAHRAGLAHRNISADTVHVVTEGQDRDQVWFNGWEEGEIASSSLARRVDLMQLLTLFALRVGARRAVAAASRVLSITQLAEIAPLLQPIALPAQTRAEARGRKEQMAELRAHLVELIPTAESVQPIQIARFTARTAITLTIAVVAGWVVLTTLNFRQLADVVADANPAWMVVAFGFGLLTYLGSAMGLVALSPTALGLWRTILVQVAASVVTLVAPAGVGPAALNLRFMQRRGLETPMALATVALLQLSQFVTTVLLLLAIALLTGSSSALQQLPSGAVLVVIGALLVIGGAVFAIGRLRRWVIAKTKPTLQQVWPRVVWVIGQPHRLLLVIGGNLVMTLGFLAAFGASLAAFGQSLPLTSLAIVFLTGTAVGSAIPTPGGIGTVELALSTGLTTAGIAAAAAASAAVLFRVLTFWIRVPLGWWALRHMQRRELL
ncbi:lysylphosphatidylglycerol synthase domain-containing protein [Ruania suaedae]|uniref:lysylphosphatidylglycerol synthase transmembrane domain-containing protein n=1 Tax=Ruania suaedae TaxID=2897774 RepID=UPI001E2C7078|nr:lysylphosphatidylglycerol synthase transmembrane domain-containing protein [Ruania suaedae]UFU02919.1 lysylphosphatidylglycerol synthase domain-containing protein [Ruania suaedae]